MPFKAYLVSIMAQSRDCVAMVIISKVSGKPSGVIPTVVCNPMHLIPIINSLKLYKKLRPSGERILHYVMADSTLDKFPVMVENLVCLVINRAYLLSPVF